MFAYSIAFLLITCFTQIGAPEEGSFSVITPKQFNDWNCADICNTANEGKIKELCVKLSDTQDEETKKYIRDNSYCDEIDMKLKINEETFEYFLKTVGFCNMGPNQSDKKCITKSKESNDLLIWNYELESNGDQHCDPQYEKKDWLQ